MKYTVLIFAFFLFFLSAFSQAHKMSDMERLPLTVWIPDDIEVIPPLAADILQNKLMQIATQNGISGSSDITRFIFTANIKLLTKDITPTAPVMHAYTMSINMYIGDGINGKAFSSYSTTVKGVGENETKAYLSGIKNIKTSNPEYQRFIEEGKSKIIAYFNAQCDFIIKQAKTLANMNRFEEAIWNLSTIPDVCPECWNKAQNALAPIFKQMINFDCKQKIIQANNIWNAGQSWNAANEAGTILSSIDPNSSCLGEIKTLANKIEKRIIEVDKREWKFNYDYNIGLKRDLIKAYRDIGVAWGNGQRRTIIYNSFRTNYFIR